MREFAHCILNYFAAYQKDIKDGEVAAKGLNGKTRIIAIDRYGNERPIT